MGVEGTRGIVAAVRRVRRLIWRGLRALARKRGPQIETLVWLQGVNLSEYGLRHTACWNAMLADAYVRDRRARSRYRSVDEETLRAERTSDTVFVFGSGSSLNEIGADEWRQISEHGTIGFNGFFRQRWTPVDLHIFRSALYGELRWRPYLEQVRAGLAGNELYADTTYVLQEGYLAQHGNHLVGHGVIPAGARIARYRTVGGWGPPTRSLRDGLRHVVGTLNDAVNLAFVLGWRRIVLAGVDLYDSRYFWLPEDQTIAIDGPTGRLVGSTRSIAGQRFDEQHNTAKNGVIRSMSEWGELLAGEGVELSVYNPRSLLAEHLPVYGGIRRAVAEEL